MAWLIDLPGNRFGWRAALIYPAEYFTPSAAAGGAGIKVWTGTQWAAKPLKVWTGSNWAPATLKAYSGGGWG